MGLEIVGVAKVCLQRRDMRIERGVFAARLADLLEIGLQRIRRLLDRAQHVEALHVAAAFPDRVDRRLAIKPRHRRILHHARAADAFHRLVGVHRRALADPVFAERRAEPHELVLMRVAAMIERPRHAKAQRERGLGFQREIREHIAHDRLMDQQGAERFSLAAMVDRLGDRAAHAGGGADHAVEARHRDHFDDGGNAPTLRADAIAERAAPFGLAGGVGDIAHLAFEANELDRVFASVGAPARREEAGEPRRGLREHQERIAHRRGDEELVTGDFV